MNEDLIKKLRNREVAIINNRNEKDIFKVLNYAFPEDDYDNLSGYYNFITRDINDIHLWDCSNYCDNLQAYLPKEFLETETAEEKVKKDYPEAYKWALDFLNKESINKSTPYKFALGEKVIYNDKVGIVESRTEHLSGMLVYGLLLNNNNNNDCIIVNNISEKDLKKFDSNK